MNSTDREEMTEADVRRWMLQNGVTSISLVDDVDAHVAALSRPSPSGEDVERALRALEPFAEVADEYDDGEDDSYEVWMDAGPQRLIRSSFRLEHYRRARSAAVALSLPHKNGEVDR